VELVRKAKRVAAIVRGEARSHALLVSPPLVAESEEISFRKRPHRVVQNPVGLAEARNVRTNPAAASEGSHGPDARRAPQYRVALPHEIRLGLRVPGGVELVLPGAD